jgi:hypothetical protein
MLWILLLTFAGVGLGLVGICFPIVWDAWRTLREDRQEQAEWDRVKRERNRTTLGDKWIEHQTKRFGL